MDTPTALMKSYQAEYDAALARVRASNADIQERLRTAGLSVYYDPEDDTLIAAIGEQLPAATLDLDDVIMIRHDPETWKVFGFEMSPVKAYLRAHPQVNDWVQHLVRCGLQSPGTFVSVPPLTAAEIAEQASELALA